MKSKSTPQVIFIICILIFSFIIRLGMYNALSKKNAIEHFEYSKIAENIVSGKGYSFIYLEIPYRSFAPPLCAAVISVIYKLFGISNGPLVFFQIFLSLLTCIIIYLIARRIADKMTAILALLFCAFHPGLIIYSVKKIHALSLDLFLFSLIIFSIMKLRENPSLRKAILSGILFGLAFLTRPSIVIFLPVVIVWLFIVTRHNLRRKLLNIIVIIIAATFPISFWAVRNYAIHKEFIISTTTDTEVFWIGNNPNATGTVYSKDSKDGGTVFINDWDLFTELVTIDTELGKRNFFKNESINFIKKNPGRFVGLYFRKLYYFWWFSPASGALYPKSYFILYKIFYSFILLLALVGLAYLFIIRGIDAHRNIYLLLFFLISISLFQSLYYVEGRHRWAVEPMLMIFSAAGFVFMFEKIKKAIF